MGNIKEIYAELSLYYLQMLEQNEIDHYEFTLISILLKQTVLFNKKSDGISLSQWCTKSRLSKKKILAVLEALKSKKIITKKRQKAPKKGDIYSRFSLTRVSHIHTGNPCLPEKHPCVSRAPTIRERNNDDRDEKIFSIDEILVSEYLHYLISTNTIYNIDGYKARIRREIYKGDQMTIANIREWAKEHKGIKI